MVTGFSDPYGCMSNTVLSNFHPPNIIVIMGDVSIYGLFSPSFPLPVMGVVKVPFLSLGFQSDGFCNP
jgi:hypothetical protein